MRNLKIREYLAVESSPFARAALTLIVIAALSLAAYSNSFHDGFHLDDGHQITANHYIRNIANIPRFFIERGVNSAFRDADFYRPVTTSSFAVNYYLGGLAPAGYHVFNLTFHIFNALLVFLIVQSVLDRSGYKSGFLTPLSICMLFALHPIQTGAVTYISGRAELLAVFFSLAALYSFMRFRESSGYTRYLWAVLPPLLFTIGLLSKEVAVAIIGVMAVHDFIYRPAAEKKKASTWLYYLLFIPAVALLVYARAAMGISQPAADTGLGTTEYMMSEAGVLIKYLRLLLLPINQNADYVLKYTTAVDIKVVISALLLGLMLYGLLRIRKAMPAEAFFGLWFFITILPSSSFFPIPDIAVEYRLYLPSAGFISLLVLLASRAVRRTAVRTAFVLSVLALLGILTFSRNTVYATDGSYWRDIMLKSPESGRAAMAYGKALLDEGSYAEAIPVLEKSMGMYAPFHEPQKVLTYIGTCYSRLGRKTEAETYFSKAIKAEHPYLPAYTELGSIYYETGRFDDAVGIFSRQIKIAPGNPDAEYNLGASLMMLNKNEDALEHMQNAFDYGLDNFDVHYNLALLYERTGQTPKARKHAEKALDMAGGEDDRFKAAQLISRLGG